MCHFPFRIFLISCHFHHIQPSSIHKHFIYTKVLLLSHRSHRPGFPFCGPSSRFSLPVTVSPAPCTVTARTTTSPLNSSPGDPPDGRPDGCSVAASAAAVTQRPAQQPAAAAGPGLPCLVYCRRAVAGRWPVEWRDRGGRKVDVGRDGRGLEAWV